MRSLIRFLLGLLALPLPAFTQPTATIGTRPTLFTLQAVDDRTSAELPARFTVKASRAGKTFAGQATHGRPFAFELSQTDTLEVITLAPGYHVSEELMAVTCDTCPDYEYIVRLEKERTIPNVTTAVTAPPTPAPPSAVAADTIFRNLRVAQTFRLDNVYFDQSSYVLRPESFPQLDKLIRTLLTTPQLVIEIAGHTDNVGDRRLNQALSEHRARVITTYLRNNGVAENRLHFNGYGDAHPAAPNDSEENKRKNRRVEFVVLAL